MKKLSPDLSNEKSFTGKKLFENPANAILSSTDVFPEPFKPWIMFKPGQNLISELE